MHHLNLGRSPFHSGFPLGTSPEQMTRADPSSVLRLRGTLQITDLALFFLPLREVVMRKGTWKTNPTELGKVQEPEGPAICALEGFSCALQEASSIHSNVQETLLWPPGPCPLLMVAHFHDMAASLRVSCISCETLAILCVYQSWITKQVHRKEVIREGFVLTNSNQGRMGRWRPMERPQI